MAEVGEAEACATAKAAAAGACGVQQTKVVMRERKKERKEK